MKKKGLKILSLILVFSLLLSVLTLTACTDKENNKPRKLNSIEQSIVGTWRNASGGEVTLFSDGTYEYPTTGFKGEFKYLGEGIEDGENGRGHYSKISFSNDYFDYALFDTDPNTLYKSDGVTIYSFNAATTLHRATE